MQTQVWSLNFTNFSNVNFGGFLQLSRMRAAAATPRAATCSQCSARREAAPTASVLKTPLPEVALASLDFTSFSFVWHCFSFNAKFSIVEDVELSYQLFSDTKKAQTIRTIL